MSDKPVIDIGDKNRKRLFKSLDIIELMVMVILPIGFVTFDYLCGWCLR